MIVNNIGRLGGQVELQPGDVLSVAFKGTDGEYQVINLVCLKGTLEVEHEQTGDILIVKK